MSSKFTGACPSTHYRHEDVLRSQAYRWRHGAAQGALDHVCVDGAPHVDVHDHNQQHHRVHEDLVQHVVAAGHLNNKIIIKN